MTKISCFFLKPKNGKFLENKYIVNSTKFGNLWGKLHQFFEMKNLTKKMFECDP